MRRQRQTAEGCRLPRSGFTLVEMLVSVALVLLIMTLFAQAFGIAAGSIRKQRGLAENDQRARSMVTILLGDLQKRTFRQRTDAVAHVVYPSPPPPDPSPEQQADFFRNRDLADLENRANYLSLGLVPLHPDYYIGGAQNAMTPPPPPAEALPGGGNGAAPRDVDRVSERGYLYYSEGDLANDTDDVLKFTVDVSQTDLGNLDTTKLAGRAVPLDLTWDINANVNQPLNQDQPIWDDGVGWKDDPGSPVKRGFVAGETGTTNSNFAELTFFIRGGRLYRRQVLIRQPLENTPNNDEGEGQPDSDLGTPLMPDYYGGVNNYTLSYYNDFDNGATRCDVPSLPINALHFSEIGSLDNTIGGTTTDSDSFPFERPHRFYALGDPRNRFGHDSTLWLDGEFQGRPKEYLDPTDPATFMGSYTHEETSSPAFGFPGQPTYAGGGTSPFRFGALPGIVNVLPDVNSDGVAEDDEADLFADGPRAGEDILLSNCHGFDVKIWDTQLQQFVDIGHQQTSGVLRGDLHLDHVRDFSQPMDEPNSVVGRYQAPHFWQDLYGSRLPSLPLYRNRVFDTWHPAFNFSNDEKESLSGLPMVPAPDNDPPPNRPLWSDRDDFVTESSYGPGLAFGNHMNNYAPTAANPSGIRFWEPGTDYYIGDRVFPRPNVLTSGDAMPPHLSYFYQLVESPTGNGPGDGGTSGLEQPVWLSRSGAVVPDGGLKWKAINNTIGLRAIQISVRFYDPTSGQMRQLTLTHSFVEL